MVRTVQITNKPLGELESLADQHQFSGNFLEARRIYKSILSATEDLVIQGRILWKTGNTYNQQWNFGKAVPFYEKAESLLKEAPVSGEKWEWWIELQIDYCYSIIHLRMLELYEAKKQALKAMIEAHGTTLQKARYSYVIFNDLLWRNGWYLLPDETIFVCESLISLASTENNLLLQSVGKNMLAFTLLFRHEPQKARKVAFEVLKLIQQDRSGEEAIRAYCTICFSYRKEGNVIKAKEWCDKAYALADLNKNFTFKAIMDSVVGWAHLKEGNVRLAEELALHSYKAMTKYRYPFLAFSLLPLIAVHVRQNRVYRAVQFAFRLLAPNQSRLPEHINEPLRAAIACWGRKDLAGAKRSLTMAIQRSDEDGFL